MSDITLDQVEAIMPNIPTPPEGHEWEVFGWGNGVRHAISPLRFATCFIEGEWQATQQGLWGNSREYFYLVAKPIAKPTTLKDLFPEGESQCWVHYNDHTSSLVTRITGKYGVVVCTTAVSINFLTHSKCRYSNHPLTKWEDATPFVGKEQN